MPTDPIAVALAAAQTVLGLGLLFLLPGISLGSLVLPGAPTPLHACGRAIGLSLLTVGSLCTVLAGLGLLRPLPLTLALLTLTLAPLTRMDVRSTLIDSWRPSTRRRSRWWLGAAFGTGLVVALVLVPSLLAVGSSLLPQTSTPWYYLAVARAVAESGSIPPAIIEWGQARPFPTDYLPSTTHLASALELLPGSLLQVAAAYRLALLAAAAVVAALLFRRWFSSWIAMLGAVLLLSTVRLEAKFLDVRPETFGFVIALFTLWASDVAMAERSRRAAIVAVAGASITFLSHAEVFLLLGPGLVGLAIGRTLAGTGRIGIRRPDRNGLRPLILGAAILVGGLAAGAAANAVFAGEFRLLGYVSGARDTPPLPIDPARVPQGWRFSGDPTWDFYVATVAPALVGTDPPSNFFGTSVLPRAILQVWPGLDGRFRGDLVALAALVASPLLAWPWLDRRRRRFLLTWWVFGVALLAGSYLLFAISATYVPARVGPRRLMPYELLVPVASAISLLWLTDRILRPGWRVLFPRRGAMPAAGIVLAVLTAGAVSPDPAPPGPQLEEAEPALSATGHEALSWIDANLPPDARLVTNAYTDGSVLAVARRASILDGRAVYLEDRAFLAESTSLALGARVLFAEPDGPSAAAYLESERVSHLLVATAGPNGTDLGGYVLFDTDLAALASSARYTQVRSFGDGRLLLFEVARSS